MKKGSIHFLAMKVSQYFSRHIKRVKNIPICNFMKFEQKTKVSFKVTRKMRSISGVMRKGGVDF